MANDVTSWFEKFIPSTIRISNNTKRTVPEGLWNKCSNCNEILYKSELEYNFDVCPKCDHHMRMGARRRIDITLDQEGREEIAASLAPTDALQFKDTQSYQDRIKSAQAKTGEKDALIAMRGKINGIEVVVVVFEFGFMGGSMGSVVGERFVQAVNQCLQQQIPLVCFSASGGARMQEALFSLMQMAKTSAALKRLSDQGIPFISVLTDPTMGGVSASLSMLGDINIAEPKALIGFAGPRVIEQTVRETLPKGFQRSEFLVEHGAIDMIVDRRYMRQRLANVLAMLLHLPAPMVDTPEPRKPAPNAP